MSTFFSDSDKGLVARFLAGKMSREELAFRLVPLLTLDVIRKYLRIETLGVENIPKKKPSIIIANHSGYAGFDALMLIHEIRRLRGFTPRTVAHKLWFLGKPVRVLSEKMGLVEADMAHCLEILRSGETIILFPEGESGNFKPSHRRYRLQEFKRGFARLSLLTGAPIVPACVIGAEETHINLSQIKFTKYLIGTVIPIPLNVLPLPAKWTIKFFPPLPITEGLGPEAAADRKKVHEIANETRRILQREIIHELRKRKTTGMKDLGLTEDDEPGL